MHGIGNVDNGIHGKRNVDIGIRVEQEMLTAIWYIHGKGNVDGIYGISNLDTSTSGKY